ncbi:carbohydrate porin [Paraburkholderia sp. MM6662-R1]|uniref:carbohydrate porin n=1 Tax=Paraburkholderia sp. MM6662-R1 TaxID=2991066 RepID=UPI003D1C8B08
MIPTYGRSTGNHPRSHRHKCSFYAVAELMVWRPSADSVQSVGVFARVMSTEARSELFKSPIARRPLSVEPRPLEAKGRPSLHGRPLPDGDRQHAILIRPSK